MYYNVPVEISKQEDGLWRVDASCLQGCWVDGDTLEQALADIHEVIAMVLDVYKEQGRPLPPELSGGDALPITISIPVCPTEHKFRRFPLHAAKARRSKKLVAHQ